MRLRLVLALLGLMVVLVACGDSDEGDAPDDVSATTETDGSTEEQGDDAWVIS